MKKIEGNIYELSDEEIKKLNEKPSGKYMPKDKQKYWFIDVNGDTASSSCS